MTGKLRAEWQRPYWAVPLVRWMSVESLANRPGYSSRNATEYCRWQFYEQRVQYYFRRAACFLGMTTVASPTNCFGVVQVKEPDPVCLLTVTNFAVILLGRDGYISVYITPSCALSYRIASANYEPLLFEAAQKHAVWSLAWRDDGRSAKHLKNLRHAARVAEKACRGVFNEELSD